MELLSNVLVVMRISELEGKFFWDIRDLAKTINYTSGEIVRAFRNPNPDRRLVELTFDGRRIIGRLTDVGRMEADRILGIKKMPLGMTIRKRKPWIIDLTVLYQATKAIAFMACRTHHYYLEPYFLRGNKHKLVEPEEADIVLGIVKCTDRDKRERVPLRSIEARNIPPRIGLLFRYCLHNYGDVAEKDAELAKGILTIAGIRNLWGVRKDGAYVWVGNKRVDLRLL